MPFRSSKRRLSRIQYRYGVCFVLLFVASNLLNRQFQPVNYTTADPGTDQFDPHGSEDPFTSTTTTIQSRVTTTSRRLLPTPILVVGMPKTGTSTIYSFFNQSGYKASHHKCNGIFCGLCMRVAIKQNKPPLKSCGNYEVYAQMDVENNNGACHLPQVSDLEALHQEAPNATFVLSLRNLTHWTTSVTNWVGGVNSMAKRLSKCKHGPKTKYPTDLIAWHEQHIARIRNFTQHHPSHTLVEIDIEDSKAGEIMAQRFGSNPAFWGHDNDSTKTKISRTTRRQKE